MDAFDRLFFYYFYRVEKGIRNPNTENTFNVRKSITEWRETG